MNTGFKNKMYTMLKNMAEMLTCFLLYIPLVQKKKNSEFKYSAFNDSDKQLKKLLTWSLENNGLSVSSQMFGYS